MSSFDFFCLTFFLFPPAGYSLCRHAPSAESFARSHWSICPRPPVVPVIHATRVRQQLPSFPIHTYLSRFLSSLSRSLLLSPSCVASILGACLGLGPSV